MAASAWRAVGTVILVIIILIVLSWLGVFNLLANVVRGVPPAVPGTVLTVPAYPNPPNGNTVLNPPSVDVPVLQAGGTTLNPGQQTGGAAQQATVLMPGVEFIYNGAVLHKGDCVTFDGLSTGVSGPNDPVEGMPANAQRTLMLGEGTYNSTNGNYRATVYRNQGYCPTT
jgi:hypothetical protein